MKRAAALATTAVIAFGSILALAMADRERVSDPADDSTSKVFDIVKATAKHDGKRKLVHTVRMLSPIPVDFSDFQVSLQLNLDGDRDCEREFNADGVGRTPLIKCGVGERAQNARVSKPNARTLAFTFRRGPIIGSRPKYGWRMRVRPCPGGPPCAEDADALPNDGAAGPRYIKHRLR